MHHPARIHRLAALSGAALLLACSDSPTARSREPVAAVEVRPNAVTVTVGGTHGFSAVVLDAQARPLADRQVFWASENTSVATVSPNGVVTGVSEGSTRIAASSEGRFGFAEIEISPRRVATVSVVPPTPETTVGGTVRLRAIAFDDDGQQLSGRAFIWSSSNSNVTLEPGATPDSIIARGQTVGTATITAISEGRSGTATVTVSLIPVASVTVQPASVQLSQGATQQLQAVVRDAQNNVLQRQVTWSTNNASVAAITTDGLVTGVGVGSTQVRASVEGQFGDATITVNPAPVASVTLTAPRTNIRTGEQIPVTATLRDAQNVVITGRPINWSSSNQSVATVSSSGVVTALAPGSTTITATSEGVNGTLVFNVSLAPVGSVSVSPSSTPLFVGQTQQLTATVRDTANNVLQNRPVTWSTSSASTASVSNAGLVTANGEGTATITASSGGQSGGAQVVVSLVPVASVTVSPSSTSLFVGQMTTFSATLRDADDNVLTGRTVTWSSDPVSVATVNPNTGQATAVAPGTATITASSGGQSGTAQLTVSLVPVASVTVSPSTLPLIVGQTGNLSAELRDAQNNVLMDRDVSWSSNAASVATVNATTGQVTAVSAGAATITATSEGRTGTAEVIVSPVPVANVTVSGNGTELEVDEQLQLTARAFDAGGTELFGRPVSWDSSDDDVATVSNAGLVTALDPGTVRITATIGGVSAHADLTVREPPPPDPDPPDEDP